MTLQYQPTEVDVYSDVLSQLESDSIINESKLLQAQAKREARKLRSLNRKLTERQKKRNSDRKANFKLQRETKRREAIKQGK